MKIRTMSDLHNEVAAHYGYGLYHIPELPTDSDTVLVLAGDISRGKSTAAYAGYFADRFKAVIIVAGNHEFYKGSLTRTPQKIQEVVDQYDNIHFLDNDTVEIDDVTFIGCTLWTDYFKGDPVCMYDCKQGMLDFDLIRATGNDGNPYSRRVIPEDFLKLHKESVKFIQESLSTEGKKVVVTHHVPSHTLLDPRYAGSLINGAFASSLEWLMDIGEPDLWLFGHTHKAVDTDIYKTRCVCNPKGYPSETNYTGFDPLKLIEV